MQSFIVVSTNVATGKVLFDPLQELYVLGHHVLEVPMFRAFLYHPHLTIPLKDRGFDFSDVISDQSPVIFLSIDDLLAGLFHTAWAKRICRPWPSQCRLRFLPGFQERLI